MGKFTKALQRSKKEKRLSPPKTKPGGEVNQQVQKPIASNAESRSSIPVQDFKQPEQEILKKKKLIAEQLKRKALIKKKIMAEQARKTAALSKEIKKPAPEKIDKVSHDFDLGAIHSALEDLEKKEAPPPVRKENIDRTPPLFEAPGMDLSETVEEIAAPSKINDTVDESWESDADSEAGMTELELSPINEILENRTTADESIPVDDIIVKKENDLPDLDLNKSDTVETVQEKPEAKTPPKVIPQDSKVIPIIKKQAVVTEEQSAAITIDQTIDNKLETKEVISDNFKPANIDSNLVALLRPDSFEAEQFRMLRSNLLFPLEGKPPRSILVTSAIPGEGKSFISSNLAVTFALDIQLYVLLIDCDIRKPNIHRRFGYRQVTGLSEYLRGDMDISSILLNTNVPKLTILPGGKPPKNPSELLSSKRMSQLLEEVKEKYPDRYIILDSPPPKLTAETNVLSRQVDGILLVAKYGRTRREDLTEVIDKFGKKKIIGLVINWFNLRASRYYGYGKYGGYKYYYGKPDE